ncbi:MAG TPA: efflux RND transporter periplasmic adaptor subunit [Candidatus Didemnitutus sp.]|nr:efflux RND transporter periplasmic adaptor subunit [Candidatus Didemnitutus sp.]
MAKKIILSVVIVVVVVGGLVFLKLQQFSAMGEAAKHQVMPPTVVTAAPAKADTWENTITATGTVVTVEGVTISAELGGKIVGINFESGAQVKEGDLLVQLDVTVEEAQLRAAEANATWAKVNLERSTDLLAKNAVSKSDYDLVDAQAKQADAQVDNLRSVIAKKTIRAPFNGRLGLRQVNLGQILKEGDPIVSLQTLDPIYVNFSVPQQQLALVKTGSVIRVTTDSANGEHFEGKVTAVNPDVDPVTRNVRVQGTLANPKEILHPGMFANVEVVLADVSHVLAVPTTAILYAPFGDSVFIVEKKDGADVLRQQFIQVGDARGDFVDVTRGLKEGETVVTSGVFKLQSGIPVKIDNTLAPNAQMAPKPKDT